ncbi:TlyA family rRNA (cytidine-2'-O)-methyltransferase [Mariniluteicoccus endophyticus]
MRLDQALVARGLARSRTHAQTLLADQRVRVEGRIVTKASALVDESHRLDVDDDGWVSRAAYKLLGVLDDTGLAVPPRCLDAGSSTGGFTQVLLSRGASRVYAVDVGTDQLAPVLRDDPHVEVHEQTNLRDLTLAHVGGDPVDLVVADVSFISLTLLLEPVLGVVADTGAALLMVKPQFEVGRERLGRGGVVTDPALREEAVTTVVVAAEALGWSCLGCHESHLPGPAGNVETFVHLSR